MLNLAQVGADDVVYDLGCGDGRILIAASQRGARGVGIDLDPERIAEARRQAEATGIADRVALHHEDFFVSDLRPASVIALYLLDSLNLRLRPRILAQCRPGTRVVSYSFEMGDWTADDHVPIAANGVSLWVVPADLSGHWLGPAGSTRLAEVTITQRFQMVAGTACFDGRTRVIRAGRITGDRFTLTLDDADHGAPTVIAGKIAGELIEGTIDETDGEVPWTARRTSDPKRGAESPA